MKRVLCMVLCLITVFSCLALTISAAEEPKREIMEELSGMTIDGKPFDVNDYPVDTSQKTMKVITAVELGFEGTGENESPDFAFVIYVYNPSCIKVSDAYENTVNIAASAGSLEYNKYSLKAASSSTDLRFMKFFVQQYSEEHPVSKLYETQTGADNRVYCISRLFFRINNTVRGFSVAESFAFSGKGDTLTSNRATFNTVKVNLEKTSWISPNAGAHVDGSPSTIYDHYEISSVYFKVPKKQFDNGKLLASIRASYDQVRLTPMILTTAANFADEKGQNTKDAIIKGDTIEYDAFAEFYDLAGLNKDVGFFLENSDIAWCYTKSLNDRANSVYFGKRIDRLAYYFEIDVPSDFEFEGSSYSKMVVSSNELEAYFKERYKEFSKSAEDPNLGYLYSSRVSKTLNVGGNLLDMSLYKNGAGAELNWWEKFTLKDDSYLWEDFKLDDCKNLEVIDDFTTILDPSGDMSDAEIAAEYYISEADVGKFKEICQEAAAETCNVVILRFGFSDYKCAPVIDPWKALPGQVYDVPAMWVEKNAFLNMTVGQLTFQQNDEKIIVPVCSNSVDVFGNVWMYEDPSIITSTVAKANQTVRDLLEKLKDILKWLLLALLVVVLAPVLSPVLRFVISAIGSVLRGAGGLFRKRKRKKNDQNRKE